MSHLLRQRDQKRLLLGSKYIGALNITSLVYLLHPLFRVVLNSEELDTEEPYFVVTAICCQVWLATGSDLGGSLRTPASFCGVVGLRPSVGRVPQGNSLHQPAAKGKLQLHAVSGPMARNVPDLALFLDAMAHQHPKSVSQSSKDMLGVPALGVSFSLWVLFHCSLSSPLPPPPPCATPLPLYPCLQLHKFCPSPQIHSRIAHWCPAYLCWFPDTKFCFCLRVCAVMALVIDHCEHC